MILGRLLMRLLLVPLGAAVAVVTAMLFVVVAHWNRFADVVTAESGSDDAFVAFIVVGSSVMLVAAVSAVAMLLPAALGALIAEAFAIRSWIFHAANGGLSSWIANGGLSSWAGLQAMVEMRRYYDFYSEPIIVIGAGIVAGFAYWIVAGWSAGFWKPVFAPPNAAPSKPDAGPSDMSLTQSWPHPPPEQRP